MSNTSIESELLIKAINNEVRRNIIRLLMGKSLSYTEIAHLLNYNLKKESGKFNFHLKQLTDVGILGNENDLYTLTDKGEEMYYLLLDIERDREIDPYGMLTALIRLQGHQQFWFFVSSLGIIVSLWALMLGSVAIFALDDTIELLIYGGTLLSSGIITGFFSTRYYISTANNLLGNRSAGSKLFSTMFFFGIEWYLIRAKGRIWYLFAALFTLVGSFFGLLAGLLHLGEGVQSTGRFLYILDVSAVVALLLGMFILRYLYQVTSKAINQN